MTGMTDEEEYEETGDPAQAFEALRGEVAVLRQAVQALPSAWQDNRPPDYSPDLGRLVKGLMAVEQRLGKMEALPMLSVPPGKFAAAADFAARELMEVAAETLKKATWEARQQSGELATMIGSARSQDVQNSRLYWTGLIAALVALLVGLFFSPSLASILPFGWNQSVAATVMGTDRWDAGAALMQASNPQEWDNIIADWKLINGDAANARAVSDCRTAVAKTGRSQTCRITVQAIQP